MRSELQNIPSWISECLVYEVDVVDRPEKQSLLKDHEGYINLKIYLKVFMKKIELSYNLIDPKNILHFPGS